MQANAEREVIRVLTAQKVIDYCIKNNFFTHGDNMQYKRVLELAEKGFPLHDIATMIWICSETDKHATEIEHDLVELSGEGEYVDW